MKLFLMRHAEAETKLHSEDVLRNLTKKGIMEAENAAEFLQGYHIDKILTSHAIRAKQTAEIIQNKIKCPDFEVSSELYPGNTAKIIELILAQSDEDKTILVISHNPGVFKTALALMDPDSPEYDSLIESGMTTAKIVPIDFPHLNAWKDLSL